MSEKFDMLVWRANAVDANGDIFTSTALASMADVLLPDDEILLDFQFDKPVGKIVQAWIKNDELHVSAVITDDDAIESIREGKANLRPGFSIGTSHLRDGNRVIDEVSIVELGLVFRRMPLPRARICAMCSIAILPNDDLIEVCGPCIAERR